jgi:hypothetical protein
MQRWWLPRKHTFPPCHGLCRPRFAGDLRGFLRAARAPVGDFNSCQCNCQVTVQLPSSNQTWHLKITINVSFNGKIQKKYHVDYQRAYRAGMTNLVFALEPKQVIASWGWCIEANDVSVYWRLAMCRHVRGWTDSTVFPNRRSFGLGVSWRATRKIPPDVFVF